jgi:hypothetical protein
MLKSLLPLAARLVSRAQTMAALAARWPLPVADLKQAQAQDEKDRADALDLSLRSPACGPAAIALLRDLQSDDGPSLAAMARSRTKSYRRWQARLAGVEAGLKRFAGRPGRSAHARPFVIRPAAKSA